MLESPIRVRVNTVVGPHNFDQLIELYAFLIDMGVDDWSIIPLKLPEGPWLHKHTPQLDGAIGEFKRVVRSDGKLRLIGHSDQWFGRSAEEEAEFRQGIRNFTPNTACSVPYLVRYYVPQTRQMFFCNCVPHRLKGHVSAVPFCPETVGAWEPSAEADWLHTNGPDQCRGCEPANAAFGEGSAILERDTFAF